MFDIYEIDPYGSILIVGIGEDPHNVATKLNINNPGIDLDYPVDHVAAITFERILKLPKTKSIRQYIIIIIDPKYAHTMTVAHETVHAVNYIFKYVGVNLDLDNDEPQAYLTGYIADRIQRTIANYKKERRRNDQTKNRFLHCSCYSNSVGNSNSMAWT